MACVVVEEIFIALERSVSLKPGSYRYEKAPVEALPLGSLYLLLDFPPNNSEKHM